LRKKNTTQQEINMSITIHKSQKSILEDMYQGAREGAATGAFLGAGIVAATMAVGTQHALMETTVRAMGFEPRQPLFEGDCQLEQFRNVAMCTTPPLFSSFSSFAAYTVSATTLAGMAIGAVSGATKHIFQTRH
jgi:hypothetical protein